MSDKGPIEQIKELAPQASLEVDLAVASHNAAVLRHKIIELKAQIKEDALQYLSDTGQMGDTIDDLTRRHQHALQKIDVLEDEIERLKADKEKLLSAIRQMQTTSDARMLYIARTTLAEIEGQNDD